MSKVLVTLVFSLMAFQTSAHEGHDHGPKAAQAPKGGLMRELETVNLELLSKGNSINVYIYDKAMKPADASKYEVSATITPPRKGAEPVELTAKSDHWEAEYDAKGIHRYTFTFHIKQGGHADSVKFTVEPRK